MLPALLKTMRPRQWTKNLILFAPLVFDKKLFDPYYLLRVLAAFLLFCLISSTVYIINDLADLEADRRHPQKRTRPIASGRLPVPVAQIAAVVLVVVTLALSLLLSGGFALLAGLYFVLNLAYSLWLKHIPILDVLMIAAGFVLRVGAGVVVSDVVSFSPWLYVVTTLLSLFLGFGKRRAEMALLADEANSHRRVLEGYSLALLDQFITIVSASTILVYSLYTFNAPIAPDNHAMMFTIPFVLYGVFRYLWLIQIKHSGGAPEELLLSDRPLQVSVILWALAVFLIYYILF
jgi:4-hydroxybenzoate polyprenyltransferase